MAKSRIDSNTHLLSQKQRLKRGEAVTGQTLKAGGTVKKVADKDNDKMAKGGCVMKKGGKC